MALRQDAVPIEKCTVERECEPAISELLGYEGILGAAVIAVTEGLNQGYVVWGQVYGKSITGQACDVADSCVGLDRAECCNRVTFLQIQLESFDSNSDVKAISMQLDKSALNVASDILFVVWVDQGYDEALPCVALKFATRSIETLAKKHDFSSVSTNIESHTLDMLDEVSRATRAGGWVFNLQTRELSWTDETYRIYGLPIGSSLDFSKTIAPFSYQNRLSLLETILEVLESRHSREILLSFSDAFAHEKFVKTTVKALVCDDVVSHIYGSIVDVTEQQRLYETQHNFTLYLSTILDNLNDAVVSVDIGGMIITANETCKKVFGYGPEELIGEDVESLIPNSPVSKAHKGFDELFDRRPNSVVGGGNELVAIHKSGREFPIELTLSEVELDGETRFIGIISDITERKEAIDHIYRIAYFDEVTQLPNVRSFEDDIVKFIVDARHQEGDIFCAIVDIDNFAQYNMSFGKETGDYILKVMAGRIHEILPDNFVAYRGMGDNFFVLYHGVVSNDSRQIDMLNRLEWELHTEMLSDLTLHGHSQKVTSAIASTLMNGTEATYEKVVGILEFGKKRAKQQGAGGRVSLSKQAFADYERHNFISQSFTYAIKSNEFYVELQPQYDASGRIVSSEALLRWNHRKLGVISPGEFIPIAEESDAIVDIGYWVLDEACRLLAECRERGLETSIAVNISGRHIARPDFGEKLLSTIHKWSVPPTSLILEITETTLVSSIDLVRKRIERLSALGFAFSIDDFGTGYSSLSYLKELPIKELKIDRYFIDEINFEGTEVPIVNTIIDMSHAMGVRTVAEGIENKVQMDYLVEKGCEIYQGFYLNRPLVVDKWLTVLFESQRAKTN